LVLNVELAKIIKKTSAPAKACGYGKTKDIYKSIHETRYYKLFQNSLSYKIVT